MPQAECLAQQGGGRRGRIGDALAGRDHQRLETVRVHELAVQQDAVATAFAHDLVVDREEEDHPPDILADEAAVGILQVTLKPRECKRPRTVLVQRDVADDRLDGGDAHAVRRIGDGDAEVRATLQDPDGLAVTVEEFGPAEGARDVLDQGEAAGTVWQEERDVDVVDGPRRRYGQDRAGQDK